VFSSVPHPLILTQVLRSKTDRHCSGKALPLCITCSNPSCLTAPLLRDHANTERSTVLLTCGGILSPPIHKTALGQLSLCFNRQVASGLAFATSKQLAVSIVLPFTTGRCDRKCSAYMGNAVSRTPDRAWRRGTRSPRQLSWIASNRGRTSSKCQRRRRAWCTRC
jgi:hypothetical protein